MAQAALRGLIDGYMVALKRFNSKLARIKNIKNCIVDLIDTFR